MPDNPMKNLTVLLMLFALSACVTTGIKPEDCPGGTQKLEGCPPIGAIDDPRIAEVYASRTWQRAADLDMDPIEFASNAEIPINHAQAKFIGSDKSGGLTSLATKIHMIEQAEHTVDVVYYIFRDDLVGLALFGALCDAVERGVDVRIMVDSLGSFNLNKKHLKALQSCALDAGFMRNADGDVTIYKARVQPVVFNAISKIFVNHNRRSHDKLLVVDGRFPEKSYVMTGGRNISLAYYGILPDGSDNPDTYRDAEIFLRGGDADGDSEWGVGAVSATYYDMLFLFRNNKLLSLSGVSNPRSSYQDERDLYRKSLADLSALPRLRVYLEKMPEYVTSGFHDSRVRLAHELTNLTNKDVVYGTAANAGLNPNSIMAVLDTISDDDYNNVQLVSPYLFAALYTDRDKNVILDDAENVLRWLDEGPNRTLDIVTNSALTSDNYFTQSVIDMDLAPRLLLTEEMRKAWLEEPADSEANSELVESDEWARMINHPRLRIYETGTLEDVIFGGDVAHGKQHGKYIVSDDWGFVGTTNFDYRSMLYNNEMGFLFESQALADDIRANTDYLIGTSYLWGSADWLEMRRRLMEQKGTKASTTRDQRRTYKTLKKTGTIWYF